MRKDLTPREQEIFNMLVDGNYPKDIANKLNISYSTVDFHRGNIYRKLGVHNIQEFIAKYKSGKYTGASSEPEASLNKKAKKTKFLIPFGILIITVSIVFIWRFFIKPSVPLAHSGFEARTFDLVYLRAVRWVDHFDENHYGENYNSLSTIKLTDIYPGGFDSFMPPEGNRNKKLRLSGTVDTRLCNIKIDIVHISLTGKTVWLGGSSVYEGTGPGKFSREIVIRREYMPVSELPPGEIIIQLIDALFNKNLNPENDFDSGRRIPDDIPDGTIMATIRGFKIEPVD